MADIIPEVKAAPKQFLSHPVMAVVIGLLFLLMVLFVEAFKPGLVTGPFKALLRAVGVSKA